MIMVSIVCYIYIYITSLERTLNIADDEEEHLYAIWYYIYIHIGISETYV